MAINPLTGVADNSGDAAAFAGTASGGIVNNAAQNLQKYDPTAASVNPSTDTVQGRVTDMMTQGNPLLDRAQSLSMQRSNDRGLVNSSIAQQAGTTAMLDTAAQIAAPDAAAANQQRLANQNYANTASQFNAGEANTLTKMGTQNALTQSNMALGNTFDINKINVQADQTRQTQAAQGQIDLSKISASSAAQIDQTLQQIKANAEVSKNQTGYQAALNASAAFTTEVNRINGDDKMDASVKPGMLAAAEANLKSQLAYYGAVSGADHGALLGQIPTASTQSAVAAAPAPPPPPQDDSQYYGPQYAQYQGGN